jgi:large subunit ribosomal protein L10
MAISKDKKRDILAKVSDIFAKATSVAFVKFSGLTVAQVNEVRRTLKEKGVGYYVAKKSLIRRALGERKIGGEIPALEGEIALAYTDTPDTLSPGREVGVFGKKFAGALALVGGIFEGMFVGAGEALSLAAIPGRETLLAQFVNLVNSPLQRLAVVLNEISKNKK